MALLVSRVFGDEMKVFAADDEGSVHLCRHNSPREDTATDGDFAGEGAFLVYQWELVRSCSHPYPVASVHLSGSMESYQCMCPQSRSLVS